jgi:putative ABC transport system permease protein
MKRSGISPPAAFLRFFRWFCHPTLRDHIEGDLVELYREEYGELGKRKADFRFVIDVLKLFRPGIIRPIQYKHDLNPYTMYKSYVKTGWRNLVRNKGYAFINITGLAVGMMVAMLIGLWIADELSFNSFFEKRDRMAQVFILQSDPGGEMHPGPVVAPIFEEEMRMKFGTDFKSIALASYPGDFVLKTGDNPMMGTGRWVQKSFPELFNLEMISGNRDVLKDPSTMMVSRSLAKSLFGSSDPMGKTVRVLNRFDLVVGGVYEDLPANTTFAGTKLLLSWDHQDNWMRNNKYWDNHVCQMFVEIADNTSIEAVSEKIRTLPTAHITGWKEELMLYPLERLHLYSPFEEGASGNGLIRFVWLFGTIGFFVLMLACINFMNLSTARSEKRAKEVGIRKTIGSLRTQLVGQFLTESAVVACMALVLALLLVSLALPAFNTLAHKSIAIQWSSPLFWVLVLGFTIFAGVVSGSYPAFYLSSFLPVKVLKGTFRAGRMASLPRKVLVVVQFTVSIVLIIGTVVVFQQIQFAKDLPTGYSRAGLITVPMNTPEIGQHFEALKTDLLRTGVVEHVAKSSQSPAAFNNNVSIDWPGKGADQNFFIQNINVSPNFGQTIGWTIKEGRDFSADIVSDSMATIINEAAVEELKVKDPIGMVVTVDGRQYQIVGVAKNMITRSPYDRVQPAIFFTNGWFAHINIRMKNAVHMHEALEQVGMVFKKHDPGAPFEYRFIDNEYATKFADEERIGTLAGIFSTLAIFISCLGLSGLAAFVAEQRTKEIGIRKTMGASVISLWKLLSRDFIVLVTVAFVIAVPVSVLFMTKWLEGYHHHTALSAVLFMSVGIGALMVALITVSYQAIRAAMANPVRSLRAE